MKYTNHFSEQSAEYLQFRPTYPDRLFEYLAGLVSVHETAWDCGTGNGQAAVMLAPFFQQVIASDANQPQLDQAPHYANIHYHHWPAEKTPIANASVDLITVAQALHWFDFTRFYQEVKRVLKPEGVMAAWCYSLGTVTPAVDPVIKKLYSVILGDKYWPKERLYIDMQYKTVPFPFRTLTPPFFHIEKEITFDQLLGYLMTWSAVKEYQKRNGTNPIEQVLAELVEAWGDTDNTKYVMRWPIHLLVGRLA